MRKKYFLLLLGLLIGIGLFINFESLNSLYILFGSLTFTMILFLINKNLIIVPLALLLGFNLALFKFNKYSLKDKNPQKAEITILEKRSSKEGFRYFVDVRTVDSKEKSVLFADDDFDIGDILLVKIIPKIPNRNTNPNLFNYRNYLISKNIASSLEIDKVYARSKSSSLGLKLRNKFYNYAHNLFDHNLSKNSANFAFSVILGENLIQNEDIKDLGLAHILAVSGLHIDMLVAFILFIVNKFNINYKYGYGFALLICLVYGYLISFPFSVIRVLIINLIGFLSFLFQMPEDKLKSLLIAANLILLINPFAFLNAGYVLSFIATSAVYLVYPKLKIYLKDNMLLNRLGFTTSIQLAVLPFIIYYYGKVNLLAVIANFLILPLFTISMYAIFIAIISYPLLKIVLLPVFKLIDYLLASILNLTSILNSISVFAFEFAHPNILVSLYLYVLIVVMLYMKKSNKILLKHFYIVNIFVVIISLLYESVNNEISYSMIDIGQGDAFLINDGGDYYLIDVGGPKYDSYDSGEKILVPYLKSLGIKEINAVFISHEDNDHCGNLPILYNNFKINNLITGPYNTDGLREYHPIAMHKNNRMKLKNGYIECIFEGSMGEENAESLGLLVNIKGVKILSMGDLPKEYEDTLDIKADVLKISHHGSKTSTSKSFVEKVNPKVALISAGRNNRYGHPTKEVLDNLEGVKIYNSQESGMVKIVFGNSTKIESYLKGGYFKWIIKNLWPI